MSVLVQNRIHIFDSFIKDLQELPEIDSKLSALFEELLELMEIEFDKKNNNNSTQPKGKLISRKRKYSDVNEKIDNYYHPIADKKHSPRIEKRKQRKTADYDSELCVSSINVEILAAPVCILNEYSRLSFESTMKRPYNLGANLSSAKTNMSYSSYNSNMSNFSFGPRRSGSDLSLNYENYSSLVSNTPSTVTSFKRGINSILASNVNTIITKPKRLNNSSQKKKKSRKSALIEKIGKRVCMNKEDNYRDQKLFDSTKDRPLRNIVNSKFYRHNQQKENEEVNNIDKTPTKINSSLLGHKRISPLMTRSAYKKSHSRKSSMTEDEVIEYCTPITTKTKTFTVKPSPTKNLSNLFRQIQKD
jgi:hypothetical protein